MSFSTPRAPGRPADIRICALIIIAILLVTYANSFSGAFVFDDDDSISQNPTIRSWSTAFFPPGNSGITVSGRPLLNFSLAINYAISGTQVWSYHLVNLLLHITATLLLFGFVRRTLLQPALRPSFGEEAGLLAACVALLWGLHPLQTESVTYIVQRAESLAGLCYFLTLYAFTRATGENPSRPWLGISVAACFLGMASKEIVVSAPLMVLLYDRTFISPDFVHALRLRRRYYLALASSWILLAFLVWQTGNRGGSAGLIDTSWWSYGLTQCEAVVRYLSLSLLPMPLTFDYGTYLVHSWSAVWLQMLLLVVLVVAALVALWRRQSVAFPLLWFFAILAPTSSIVPLTQTMAEHRMYLPLAGILVLLVLGLRHVLSQWSYAVFALFAVGFAFLTFQRNFDYRDETTIWGATVSSRPQNPRAWVNLGNACHHAGDSEEAINCYEAALHLDPDSAEAHCNLGSMLAARGLLEPGLKHFQEALRINPNYADAHVNMGLALLLQNQIPPALIHFETAAKLKPDNAEIHRALGVALLKAGRPSGAEACFAEATRLDPSHLQKPKFFRAP